MSELYARYREQRGIRYPSKRERAVGYARIRESRLLPDGALALGYNPTNGRSVYFLPEELKTHLHVIGWSQKGKTNLLRCLAKSLLEQHEKTGEGFAVIDPHGVLAEYVFDLCVAKGEAFAERVVYFDLREEGKVPIFNPLRREYGVELVAASFVEAVAKALGRQFTMQSPLISEVLRNTVSVLLHNELSLAEAGFFSRNTPENLQVRERLLEAVPDKALRDFWEEFAALSPRDKRAETAPAARRFDYLLSVPTIRRIVGQSEVGIDLGTVMDEGQIAIFNLATEGTEVPLEAQHLMGALLIQEFRAVTLRRTPEEARTFTLIVDEFGNFVSHDVMSVFTEAAKFGLRCVLAHHGLWQLRLPDEDPRLRASVLGIGQKVIFGGGLVEEQLALAQQAYGGWVDPDKRKLELWTKAFRPFLRKEVLRSYSHTSGEVESSSSGSAVVSGSGGSMGTTTPPEREATLSEVSSWQEGVSEVEGSSVSHSESESEGWHEAYVTDHEEFEQLSSVQFENTEEQIFREMQRLHGQPVGRCVVVKSGEAPQPCQVPLMGGVPVSEAERRRFRERVYEKACYLTPAEAEQQIEARRRRLLEEGVGPRRLLPAVTEFDPDEVWEPEEDE